MLPQQLINTSDHTGNTNLNHDLVCWVFCFQQMSRTGYKTGFGVQKNVSSLNKIFPQLVFYLINALSIIKLKVFLNLFSCLFMPVINVAFTSLYLFMQLKESVVVWQTQIFFILSIITETLPSQHNEGQGYSLTSFSWTGLCSLAYIFLSIGFHF